jgi:Zn2+/Cd2+-exporting ATPase
MTSVSRQISIPFISDREDDFCCPQILVDMLLDHKGIVEARLDSADNTLEIGYRPDLIDLTQVNRLAKEAGVRLRTDYDHFLTHMHNNSCRNCASEYLEKRLAALPGIPSASVNTVAGVISASFDPTMISQMEIKQTIIDIGFQLDESGESRPAASLLRQELVEPTLVLLTLLGLVGGVAARALGAPGWLVSTLAAISYAAGGYFGLKAGIRDLLKLQINVDLLMILAATGAAIIGSWAEGATLLFLFSLSNLLQNYALDRSRNAIRSLLDLRPTTALVRRNDKEVMVAIDDLVIDDVVIVKPGERIGVDGVVVTGQSAVDQSSITGESVPVDKEVGDKVFAGTVNQHGSLVVRVTKLAADNMLSKIITMVEEAQARRAPTQRFIDTFEQYYAIAIIAAVSLFIAIQTLLLGESFPDVFYRGMVLLVVASPCALVISTPASILSAIADAARKGILFKGGAYLENLATIKGIAFDKTGTLTYGRPMVTDVVPVNDYTADQLLALTASVEERSEHPIAQAVVAAAEERGLEVIEASDFQAYPGMGISASVDGTHLLVGSRRMMEQEGLTVQALLTEEINRLEREGKTVLLVHNEECVGAIAVADRVRPESREAVAALRKAGVEQVIMLTGDNETVAGAIAAEAGLDNYHAGLMPQDKVDLLRRLEAEYGPVAMVGDGVNDAPALATASIGIAMGAAGTDVALETADVVLMTDDLSKISYAIALSKRARRIVWQNIAFSLSVIVILIMGAFGLFGQALPLPLGVVGHEGSTVLVVFNGLRLLAFGARRGLPSPSPEHLLEVPLQADSGLSPSSTA